MGRPTRVWLLMTQYHDLVRRMRYKLKAEAWAKVSKKTKVIHRSNMSLEEMLDAMQREEADAIFRN